MGTNELLDHLYDHVLNGEVNEAATAAAEGLRLGLEPMDMVYGTMIPALEEVGDLFETAEYFLPEMLTAAKAMQAAMDVLRPHLIQASSADIGTVVIGTVAGDIHDIGKNLCSVMLEAVGFKIIDLGINVPSATFVSAVREHNPHLVGMSAFLTTTIPQIESTMTALKEAGLRDSVKVMVGGAPVTPEYAAGVGADGYAPDASSAAREAKLLVTGRG